MQLTSVEYSQYDGQPRAWYLDAFELARINLIVGKNATGKTKILNIIGNMSNLFAGEQKFIYDNGNYHLRFDKETENVQYSLLYKNNKVESERLIVNKKTLLDRGLGGKGNIFATQLRKQMAFQTPDNELATVARRDSVQHPFFDDFYQWGKSCFHYKFGEQLGKDKVSIFIKLPESVKKEIEVNPKETDRPAAGLFRMAEKKFGKKFVQAIKNDMAQIGYKLSDIGVASLPGAVIIGAPQTEVEGLYVQEKDLQARTFQLEMSQGMYRALSLIIQLTYAEMASLTGCVLIDDIGEGLDFDRSTALIKRLISKAEKSSIQLVMSTNDRFVMNNVPLKYWCVIQRVGQRTKIFNYKNSRKIFDEFRFTGLNNFDFLSSEFYLTGFIDE